MNIVITIVNWKLLHLTQTLTKAKSREPGSHRRLIEIKSIAEGQDPECQKANSQTAKVLLGLPYEVGLFRAETAGAMWNDEESGQDILKSNVRFQL